MESLAHRPLFLVTALVLIAAELAWRLVAKRGYDVGEAAASFGVAAGDIAARLLSAGVMGSVFMAIYAVAPFKIDITDPWMWVLAFLLVEFVYYWFHRFSHTVRWLWATHAVHHSAHELVLPSALRLGWTGLISGGWLMFTPLILAGFHPAMVAGLLAANLAYQFILHTELIGKLGPLEWVLNTPAHHRVHHASNEAYLDKNFGGVLILFDRMFGTFAAEAPGVVIRYGLVHDLKSKNPVVIALHEWGAIARDIARAGSLRRALAAAFGRPG